MRNLFVLIFYLIGFVISGFTAVHAQSPVYKGKILSADGTPVPGASLQVTKRNIQSVATGDGSFQITGAYPGDSLLVSSIGFAAETRVLGLSTTMVIFLQPRVKELDQTIVMAYGRTTRRTSTGNISKVVAADIARQPVSNPLGTLEGLVPGLNVSSTSGLPGSAYKVQLRGQRSLTQGSQPLFVIDGVPYAPNNGTVNQLSSAVASFSGLGLSPLNGIDPASIESIEVLKDADATAIYGSRGANGVILITTRKGKAGITHATLNAYTGWSHAARLPEILDTRTYVALRKDALRNDGLVPSATNAPDLFLWDSTREADLKGQFLSNTAHTHDVQLSLSGGTASTQFLFSGGLHRETTVYPGNSYDQRLSFHSAIHHATENGRLSVDWINTVTADNNHLPTVDLTQNLILPPTLPALTDSNGQLTWQKNGYAFTNPLAYLKGKYTAQTENLVSNLQLGYGVAKGLDLRVSAGYSQYRLEESSLFPKAAQNPLVNPTGTSNFANRSFKSWIAEPQLEYVRLIGKGKLNVLVGGSWQETITEGNTITASGYTNDALLKSVAASATRTFRNDYSQYRYEAVFGRIGYQLKERYLVNLSGRRDGSSRFGPDKRFSNFGAIGAGWIFSETKWLQRHLPALSYGKLRGSYGITGNDQIADYQYLDSWASAYAPYGGIPGLIPARLASSDYGWEENKKKEAALELGWFANKVILSVAYFHEQSGSQLVNYALPIQTGFSSIQRNFPAEILNTGWEASLSLQAVDSKNWKVHSEFQFTHSRNRLKSFPGLATSSYAFTYVEGQPLSVLLAYHLLGVDPQTGVYRFEDVDKNGTMDSRDMKVSGNLDPSWYGGWKQHVSYKGWSLDGLVSFKKQLGANETNNPISSFYAGGIYNLPARYTKRWQRPGDLVAYEKLTTKSGTPAAIAQDLYRLSDGRYSDASYIRLRNLSLNWTIPAPVLRRTFMEQGSIGISAQNLFTWTPYRGTDPETQNLFTMPPLRSIVARLQLNF